MPSLWLWRPRRCNCWVWAHRMKWRFGGYVAKRTSRGSRWVNHYLWAPALAGPWWSYTDPVRTTFRWWEALWFRGCVVEDD